MSGTGAAYLLCHVRYRHGRRPAVSCYAMAGTGRGPYTVWYCAAESNAAQHSLRTLCTSNACYRLDFAMVAIG
eukprot:102940-Rhodomonas_salina.3